MLALACGSLPPCLFPQDFRRQLKLTAPYMSVHIRTGKLFAGHNERVELHDFAVGYPIHRYAKIIHQLGLASGIHTFFVSIDDWQAIRGLKVPAPPAVSLHPCVSSARHSPHPSHPGYDSGCTRHPLMVPYAHNPDQQYPACRKYSLIPHCPKCQVPDYVLYP